MENCRGAFLLYRMRNAELLAEQVNLGKFEHVVIILPAIKRANFSAHHVSFGLELHFGMLHFEYLVRGT